MIFHEFREKVSAIENMTLFPWHTLGLKFPRSQSVESVKKVLLRRVSVDGHCWGHLGFYKPWALPNFPYIPHPFHCQVLLFTCSVQDPLPGDSPSTAFPTEQGAWVSGDQSSSPGLVPPSSCDLEQGTPSHWASICSPLKESSGYFKNPSCSKMFHGCVPTYRSQQLPNDNWGLANHTAPEEALTWPHQRFLLWGRSGTPSENSWSKQSPRSVMVTLLASCQR